MFSFWVATLPSPRRVASVYSAQETLAPMCSCLQCCHLRNMFNAAHYVCVCECVHVCVCVSRCGEGRRQTHELHFQGFKTKNFTGRGFWKTRLYDKTTVQSKLARVAKQAQVTFPGFSLFFLNSANNNTQASDKKKMLK